MNKGRKTKQPRKKEKQSFISFTILLILLNIMPWALGYADLPYYLMHRARSSFDLGNTLIQSLLILLFTVFYVVLGKTRVSSMQSQWQILNNALTAIPDVVFTADEDHNLTYINESCSRLTGYTPEEAIGKLRCHDIFRTKLCKDNCLMDSAIESNKVITGKETLIINRMGEEIPVMATVTTIKDVEGKVAGVLGIFRDMTEEKIMHARVIQAEKLSGLGQLAAGIAHEIRQPLNVIEMLVTNLASKAERSISPTPERLSEAMKIISRQIKRSSKIVANVLDRAHFSRGIENITEVSVNEVIEDCLAMLDPQMRSDTINVVIELQDGLPSIMADRDKLEQVFINIIQNARDAMEEMVKNQGDSYEKMLRIKSSQKGERVIVKISDTGGGIPQEIRDKVFDPFFTTKEKGKGTGLGLGICQDIIKSFGGEIHLRVNEGKGSEFCIELLVSSGGE